MSNHHDHDVENDQPEVFGILAEFKDPTELVLAARKIRDAGYTKWDSYSPFPVHGIDPAMGIKPTILPWLVLGAGLTGLGLAILMQWWMNAFDYPWIISGKPFFSLPANIPVAFEVTVLLSGLTTFFGVLILNMLPEHYHPLFKSQNFKRVTGDAFFVGIEAGDPKFDAQKTAELLRSLGAKNLETVMGEPKKAFALPRGLVYTAVILVVATFLPLALVANARFSKSREPRVHLVPDMDHQPKYTAQAKSNFFADKRAFRAPVAGTVAQGELRLDDAFERGKAGDAFVTTLPEQVQVNEATMARGQERFGIYCTPCHASAGGGDGMVARRAEQLKEGTWVPPTQIYASQVVSQPVGQLFNTITHGIRNMPGYGAQITPEDRWAIVLYIKALQRSQVAQLADVPADEQPKLR